MLTPPDGLRLGDQTGEVVVRPSYPAAAHLVAVGAHAAGAACDQAPEQPGVGFGATRAPLGVVVGDPPGGFEHFVGDNAGAVDRDPLVAGARDLPGAASRSRVGHGLGAVEVDPTDVCLVCAAAG